MATTVHDPVCHMDIDPASAAGTSEYEGTTYYFCAPGCKAEFDADPAKVLRAEAEYDHSGGGHEMAHAAPEAPAGESRRPWWQFWKR
ncbi:MAG TPA: YHS domain-containing protein [Dehalococcoidia bacterium]|nr:YHS domain-containing protein [Dehalococcoidia bacterium]